MFMENGVVGFLLCSFMAQFCAENLVQLSLASSHGQALGLDCAAA